MLMTFTDERITESGKHWIGEAMLYETMAQYRERCAQFLEDKYQDHLAAWEVRTGRPWDSMTPQEAKVLGDARPELMRNMGFLSRLMEKE